MNANVPHLLKRSKCFQESFKNRILDFSFSFKLVFVVLKKINTERSHPFEIVVVINWTCVLSHYNELQKLFFSHDVRTGQQCRRVSFE